MENHRSMMPAIMDENVGHRPPQSIDEGLNLVPIQDKTALLHACMVCPALVQRESPPLRFLEFEGFNYYAAAARWAKYWDLRFKLFGPDRAFLPIADFTGNGAISADLVDYIASGVAVVLPPDDQQRPVLFCDRSRIPSQCLHWSNECRQKLAFAVLQKIMLISKSFVLIFFASSKPKFFPGTGEWFSDAVAHAFPTKLSALYIVCKPPKSRFKAFAATYFPVFATILNKTFRQRQVVIDILVGETEKLLKQLVSKGLNPADIPESVGGSWNYDEYEEWVRRQASTAIDNNSLQEVSISNGIKVMAISREESNGSTPLVQQTQGNNSLVRLKAEDIVNDSDGDLTPEAGCAIAAVRNEIERLDNNAKLSYIEALTVAPVLEHTEASPHLFLAVENGNTKHAAERTVNYWNARKSIFKGLFLLPLQQKTGGVLNDVDLRTMKCGYITLLPNNNKGQTVLCCDASRLATDDEESRLRCLFYMLRVASMQTSKDVGLSVLLIMNKLSFERTKGTVLLAEILKVYPVRITSLHIIRQPARLGEKIFEEKVVPTMRTIFRSLPIPLHVHSGNPNCDLRQDLASHRFDMKNLPRSLGGGWTYEDFLKWRDQQLKFEESCFVVPKSPTTRPLPSPTRQVIQTATTQISDPALNLAPPLSTMRMEHGVAFPPHFVPTKQYIDQLQIEPSQNFAQHQQLLQCNQNLDRRTLQLNHSYHVQLAHPMCQQLDHQNILIAQQRLEHQQLMSSIQQQMSTQLGMQRVDDSFNIDQNPDLKNQLPGELKYPLY